MHIGAKNAVDIDYTIKRQRTVKELLASLPDDAPERSFFESDGPFLRAFPDGRFHCWGIPPKALPAHQTTEIGDLVLFAPHIGIHGGGILISAWSERFAATRLGTPLGSCGRRHLISDCSHGFSSLRQRADFATGTVSLTTSAMGTGGILVAGIAGLRRNIFAPGMEFADISIFCAAREVFNRWVATRSSCPSTPSNSHPKLLRPSDHMLRMPFVVFRRSGFDRKRRIRRR